MDLRTSYLGISFESPFLLASAPPTASGAMIRRAFEAGWAGAVIKTLIREPVCNLPNRFAVLRADGAIIGFENLELLSEIPPDAWYRMIADLKADFPDRPIIGSIMGDARSPEDWYALARGCQDAGADLLELNFSCPHGYPEKGKGAAIGQNADYSARITSWLSQSRDITIPLIPKLTAAVADIQHIGQAVAEAGADGICAINTIPSLFGFDLTTLRPKPDIGGRTSYGGYSGPGIKPIALRAVQSLCRTPGLPVMACGGISSGFDAAEFLLAGAPLVQVATEAMLRGYAVVGKMKEELGEFMSWHGFGSPHDFVGRCRNLVTTFESLSAGDGCMARLTPSRCVRCGRCATACNDGGFQAIRWKGGLPAIDPEACAGCSLCSHVCPAGALEMTAPD